MKRNETALPRNGGFAWLPFRWSPFWCLLRLHNPTWVFDHDRCLSEYRCFWCGRVVD